MKIKNNIKNMAVSIITIFLFVGCGSSSSDEEKEDGTILNAGQSLVCDDTTQFTVTPSNDPVVTFNTDVFTGDTTIAVSVESTNGSVRVTNCTTPSE